jgi:hypothetical protein
MLKTIGRILVILLVSGLIAGGLYLIVQNNPSALGTGDGQAGFEGRLRRNFKQNNPGSALSQPSTESNTHPTRFRAVDHDFEGGVSVGRGLLGITRSLIVFSLITLLIIGFQKAFSWIKRKRPARVG